MDKGEPNWDRMSDREWSVRAANRAGAAISMAQILRDDLRDANIRIAFLEGQNNDIKTLLFDLMERVDLINKGCSHPKPSN